MAEREEQKDDLHPSVTGAPSINFDVNRRLVTIKFRKPLEIHPIEMAIPFIVWKEATCHLLKLENQVEEEVFQQKHGKKIVDPQGG